jgi:hypothetical protein
MTVRDADRPRAVLHLYFVEELRSEAIARMYNVHRGTIARWIEDARDSVRSHVRRRALTVPGMGPEQVESMIEGAPLCALQVAEGGSLDVESGEIRENAIGACLQIEGYDVSRVTDGVIYQDNETHIDAIGGPVPPAGPRGEIRF